MTDEEKAEEYVMREDVDTMKYSECYNERVFFEKEVKKAYLDGLAEGRKEKWHEIKCCSQDLPSRSKDNHLHSVIVSNEYGEPIYYDYSIDEWCDMEGDVVSDGYKYWCELPKFEE